MIEPPRVKATSARLIASSARVLLQRSLAVLGCTVVGLERGCWCFLPTCSIAMATTASTPAASRPSVPSEGPLFMQYPVNSVLELTLAPNSEVVRGLVYCTDDVSNSVVLKKSLTHTTLASEIRIINAASITSKKVIHAVAPSAAEEGETAVEELALPLPNVNKKALEDREKRAIRLAEESFRHINEKVRLHDVFSCCISVMYRSC